MLRHEEEEPVYREYDAYVYFGVCYCQAPFGLVYMKMLHLEISLQTRKE